MDTFAAATRSNLSYVLPPLPLMSKALARIKEAGVTDSTAGRSGRASSPLL